MKDNKKRISWGFSNITNYNKENEGSIQYSNQSNCIIKINSQISQMNKKKSILKMKNTIIFSTNKKVQSIRLIVMVRNTIIMLLLLMKAIIQLKISKKNNTKRYLLCQILLIIDSQRIFKNRKNQNHPNVDKFVKIL